jgi:hypothetical protein
MSSEPRTGGKVQAAGKLFWPSWSISRVLSFHNFTQIALNRQQPRLMVNGVMVTTPAKLSVALVTRFCDLLYASVRAWHPEHILVDLEDIQGRTVS